MFRAIQSNWKGGINTYTYVESSPLLLSDLSGLDAFVCVYRGAGGFGHIGIGINSRSTTGLYPKEASRDALVGTPGEKRTDNGDVLGCKLIQTTPEQDEKMKEYMKSAPTNYSLTGNNCTNFVRGTLAAAGIRTSNSPQPLVFFNRLYGSRPPVVK